MFQRRPFDDEIEISFKRCMRSARARSAATEPGGAASALSRARYMPSWPTGSTVCATASSVPIASASKGAAVWRL